MRTWLVPAASLLGIGWYFAVCIFLGIWVGDWLDERLDTDKLFTLIGLFLGLAAALYGGYRILAERVLKPRGAGPGPEGKP